MDSTNATVKTKPYYLPDAFITIAEGVRPSAEYDVIKTTLQIEPEYYDNTGLDEHLFNIEDISEEISILDNKDQFEFMFEWLSEIKKKASYIRFVNIDKV